MNKSTKPKKRKLARVPILVVENNADHWLIIRSALAQCFPEVEPIWMNHDTQVQAYLADSVRVPRLILLDLFLPGPQQGLALLEFIKAHPAYKCIPVIILSASNDPQDIQAAYRLSVASYLVKPVGYHAWLTCFYTVHRYWWEIVHL